MKKIPIAAVPNQSFSVTLDGVSHEIKIKAVGDTAIIDVVRGGKNIVLGQRLTVGKEVLPYRYLENGNLIFDALAGDLPDYKKFDVSQFLYYLTGDELETLRNGN